MGGSQMTTIDDLNQRCSHYTQGISPDWKFTGWKPAQGNIAFLGQWISTDYHHNIQVGPLYPPFDEQAAKDMLRDAFRLGPAPENRPDLILVIRRDDPDYESFSERIRVDQLKQQG